MTKASDTETGSLHAAEQQKERKRVKGLIERDRADYAKEIARAAAEIRVNEGAISLLPKTGIEPTPEWISKGPVRGFTPRQPNGTVAEVSTVRREQSPAIIGMHRRGNISDDLFLACLWYKEMHDRSGQDGPIPSACYEERPTQTKYGRKSQAFGHMARTEDQAECRKHYRKAKAMMPARFVKFFEKVVLSGIALRRARRYCPGKTERAPAMFRMCAKKVDEYIHDHKIDAKRELKIQTES